MRRREFIAGLGDAGAWPIAVRVQQQALLTRRVGRASADFVRAFRKGPGKPATLKART
jgi:hypothetical protein